MTSYETIKTDELVKSPLTVIPDLIPDFTGINHYPEDIEITIPSPNKPLVASEGVEIELVVTGYDAMKVEC